MPSPLVSLPCGSRSMMRVGMPERARYAPRLTTVVVLPTPPFWFVQAVTRTTNAPLRVQNGLHYSTSPGGYPRLTADLSTVGGRCFTRNIRNHVPVDWAPSIRILGRHLQ